jgi:hypothetical protein
MIAGIRVRYGGVFAVDLDYGRCIGCVACRGRWGAGGVAADAGADAFEALAPRPTRLNWAGESQSDGGRVCVVV